MNEQNNPLVPFDENNENYEKYYSEEGLMDKLKKFAKKAGIKTVYAAFEKANRNQEFITSLCLAKYVLPLLPILLRIPLLLLHLRL